MTSFFFRTAVPGCCKLVAGLLLLWGPALASAQMRCASDWVARRNVLRLPHGAPSYENASLSGQETGSEPRAVVQIPVVVHVVYKSALENISDSQIWSQMAILNKDFRRLNSNAGSVPALFAPLAADMEMEFCLASVDPQGNATSGITRRETPWSNIGQLIAPDGRPRIHYTDLGGEDAWDTRHYLNIWVGTIGGGILGFGTYPGSAPPAEDGLVIDPRYFGDTGLATLSAPHHLGRTTTHEIGHYFNLLHIWGPDETSCQDDDGVADTPVQRGPYSGCPVFPQFSCGNSSMFMNFMDFTNDACMALFTEGQKVRLRATLDSVRSGLKDNPSCTVSSAENQLPEPGGWQIIPNPASDRLSLLHPVFEGKVMILLYDQTGVLRRKTDADIIEGRLALDVSDLPSGWYYLRVFSAGEKPYGAAFVKATH